MNKVLFITLASTLCCATSTAPTTWEDACGSRLVLQVYQGIILNGWYSPLNSALGTYPLNGLIGASANIPTYMIIVRDVTDDLNPPQVQMLSFGVLWYPRF